jgi:hypothetical protein
MSKLKMVESSQTSETHKKGIESHVTSYSENPTLQITTVKLDGLNYLSWSHSAMLYIKSQGKMGYMNGKVSEPKS